MLNAYEQRLVAFYLANAASALHHRDREGVGTSPNGLPTGRTGWRSGGRKRPSLMRAGEARPRRGDVRRPVARSRGGPPARSTRPPGRARGRPRTAPASASGALARTTSLSRTDVDLLELVLRYQTQPVHRIDDRRTCFRSSRRYTPLNVQNPALPPRSLASRRTPSRGRPASGFSPRPVGARLHRHRRGLEGARPAEPARRRPLPPAREPTTCTACSSTRPPRERARLVGLRPRGPRPRPTSRGCSPARSQAAPRG